MNLKIKNQHVSHKLSRNICKVMKKCHEKSYKQVKKSIEITN